MLEAQRNRLTEMNRLSEFDEDLIRKYLGLIDVEEYKIREKQLPENDSDRKIFFFESAATFS